MTSIVNSINPDQAAYNQGFLCLLHMSWVIKVILDINFRFVTGPPNMNDDSNLGKIPRVYINTEEDNEECFLLVYRALSASICLLLKSKFE